MKRRAIQREMQDGRVQNSIGVSPLFANNTITGDEIMNLPPERSESPDLSDTRQPTRRLTSQAGIFSPPIDISRELILSPK